MSAHLCHYCHNRGSIVAFRGNIIPCPLNCPSSQPIRQRMVDWQEIEEALGLKPAGQSQDTGKRNPASGSEDDGIKEQT